MRHHADTLHALVLHGASAQTLQRVVAAARAAHALCGTSELTHAEQLLEQLQGRQLWQTWGDDERADAGDLPRPCAPSQGTRYGPVSAAERTLGAHPVPVAPGAGGQQPGCATRPDERDVCVPICPVSPDMWPVACGVSP